MILNSVQGRMFCIDVTVCAPTGASGVTVWFGGASRCSVAVHLCSGTGNRYSSES